MERLRRLRVPILLYIVSATILLAFAGKRGLSHSQANHFVYLADSYLHGRLDMREAPPNRNDWAGYEELTLTSGEVLQGTWWGARHERRFRSIHGEVLDIDRSEFPWSPHGTAPRCPDDLPESEARVTRDQRRCSRYFVSFPPAPAVLMMPGVAIWGLEFNDILFTCLIAALCVPLMFTLLVRLRETGRTRTTPAQELLLSFGLLLATNVLWCSILGQVWYTALVCAMVFSIAYMHAAIDGRHPFWAGVFLAIAFASRTPLLFSVVFFAYFFFFPNGRFRRDFGKRFWVDGIAFASVPLVVGVLMLLANDARFGAHAEFGHVFLDFRRNVRINTYGLFNVHFLTMNISTLLTLLPKFVPEAPYVVISLHGLALWVTMPLVLLVVWPRPPQLVHGPGGELISERHYRRAIWLALLAIALPHMFYHNPGWAQFGYRYSLDYAAFVVVLVAFSGHRLAGPMIAALILGTFVNVFGALTFQRDGRFYDNFFIEALPTAQGLDCDRG